MSWKSAIARGGLLLVVAGLVCSLQYFATAPLGVGGYVFVLVTIEFVMVAIASLLGFWAMRGVETAVQRRNGRYPGVARFIGPGLCGLVAMSGYLVITSGYPPPIVYIVTAIGVGYGGLVTVTMWLTSSVP